MSRRVTVAIAAIVVIAVGVWAVSELADSDSSERRGSGVRVPLTAEQAEQAERLALEDEWVQRLTAGRDPRVVNTVSRYTGDRIVGARVEIGLDPPIESFDAVVPALIEPTSEAPPGTPELDRRVRYVARNVSVLRTRVDLETNRLIEIVPDGPEAEIVALRILGPKPAKYYYGRPD